MDATGRRYIDYRCGAGAVILGHARPEVDDSVITAIRRGVLFGVGTTEDEARLAELIVQHVPSVEQVLFCNSGSEATYNALRLARAITGRTRILKFQGCYHGFHDAVLVNCESQPDMVGKLDPHSAGMLSAAISRTLVARFNDLQDVARLFACYADEIAAAIVEPVAHNGPGILPKPGFLEGLRELCNRHRSILIYDEVITGFRHALGGWQSIDQTAPDLTVLGKAIANGYPLAALGGRREYMERFSTHPSGDTVWAGTYNASALGVAAALATISSLEHGDVYAHIYDLGDRMRAGLREITARAEISATVCGYGSLFSLWFIEPPVENYDDVARHDLDLFVRYRTELIRRGVFEYPSTDGARSHISASHTVDDITQSLEHAEIALRIAIRPNGGS